MRIFNPLTVIQAATGNRGAARDISARWRRAVAADPELMADVIRLGGLMGQSPRRFEAGQEVLDPLCPIRMGVDAGRRDLATEILALMNIDENDLRDRLETDHE